MKEMYPQGLPELGEGRQYQEGPVITDHFAGVRKKIAIFDLLGKSDAFWAYMEHKMLVNARKKGLI